MLKVLKFYNGKKGGRTLEQRLCWLFVAKIWSESIFVAGRCLHILSAHHQVPNLHWDKLDCDDVVRMQLGSPFEMLD